jgi:protein-tyrosine phosphatase
MTLIKRLKQWVQREPAEPEPRPDATRVLMVCTGNICRSPIAEGVLRAKIEAAGLAQRVVVDSAGTHGYHTSEAPDPRAIRAAAARGYEIAKLQARPVEPADFEDFHWILALDEGHLKWLAKRAPEGHDVKLELLMAHASRHEGLREVPDPYYGPDAGFERVLDLVEDACDGVVARLRSEAAAKA